VHEDRAAQPPSAERYAESVAGCSVLLDEHLAEKLSHSCAEGTRRRVGEAVGIIELGGTRPARRDRTTAKRSAEASTPARPMWAAPASSRRTARSTSR
jgi:hypothetical protein